MTERDGRSVKACFHFATYALNQVWLRRAPLPGFANRIKSAICEKFCAEATWAYNANKL